MPPLGQSDWPKGVAKPEPDDLVQVIMSERMARVFESKCLVATYLAGPLLFSEDDLPTYTLGVRTESA